MKTRQRITVPILADREVFDYLKEKVGERKTKTEAYCDLLDKALAGFVSPFLRNQEFELHPNQCHVTVSDLSVEWHWHRATVRSFLDALEGFGLLSRIRLSKSVIITMNVQNGSSVESCSGQQVPEFADLMHEVLSDWITGKTDTDETGIRCGQLIRQAMDRTAMQDNLSCPDSVTHIGSETGGNSRAVEISQAAQECIALAALQRALRKSRFDDVSGAMDYFHLELYGDWSGLLATANELSGLLFDESRANDVGHEEDRIEGLKALIKPFLALAAKAQEKSYQTGD